MREPTHEEFVAAGLKAAEMAGTPAAHHPHVMATVARLWRYHRAWFVAVLGREPDRMPENPSFPAINLNEALILYLLAPKCRTTYG